MANELQDYITGTVVEQIVDQVVQKLLDSQKMALVVFTGALLGFDKVLEELRALREQDGFCFDVLMTYNAEQVLDTGKINETLKPGWLSRSAPEGKTPEQLATPYPTILVPSLTLHSAAQLANLTPESPAMRAVHSSLIKGKNVVLSVKGCCPDQPERIQLGYRMTEPLKQRYRDNLQDLKSFGATLANVDNFRERTGVAIARGLINALGASKDSCAAPAAAAAAPATVTLDTGRRVVSRADIAACARGGVVRVSQNALVTEFAKDYAKANGITLVCE